MDKEGNSQINGDVPTKPTDIADIMAQEIVSGLTPLEIGKLIHPDAESIKFKYVPREVIEDHLNRYSKSELKRGQFFRVRDKYTFFMDHESYKRRNSS
ncbi:hypothetical protein ACFLQ0_05065 [Nitrospinota bacterium]